MTVFALNPTCVATHVHRIIVVLLNSPVVWSARLSLSLSICQNRKVALTWPNSHCFTLTSEPCLIVHELCLSVCTKCCGCVNLVEMFTSPFFCPGVLFHSRFLPAYEVALYAWGKAFSSSASQESDDLCASRGAGILHLSFSLPQPSQRSFPKVCPSPGHAAPPRHLAALPARRSVQSSPEPRAPAPASVRQLARSQPHHWGAQ